jgi:hypothetical protein
MFAVKFKTTMHIFNEKEAGPFKIYKDFNSTIGFVPLWAHYIKGTCH